MKTLKLRIYTKHSNQLEKLSSSVNFVWNYVNDLGYKYLQKHHKFLSAYDLNKNTKVVGNIWVYTPKPFKPSMKSTPKAVNNSKRLNQTGEPTIPMPNIKA